MAQSEKILTFFNDEFPHLGLTSMSLKNPHFDIAFEAYRHLTGAIFGFPESVFVPDENEPQKHIQVLFRLMQDVINDITTDSFLISDLINPKPTKFRFFVSALVDFYKFIHEHVKDVDSLFAEVERLQGTLEDDRTAIAKLGDEIQKQKQQNEIFKRKRLEVSSKVSQLQADCVELQKEKEEIKAKVSNENEQIEKKKQSIEELEKAIKEATEESRQLNFDIISSPDKIFAEIQRTEEMVAKEEEKINNFRKTARDSARKKVEVEKWEKDVESFQSKISDEIDAKLKLVKEHQNAVKESGDNLLSYRDLVSKAEREFDDNKNAIKSQIRKLEDDGVFLQDNIDCTKKKILALQQAIERTYEDADIKEKRDKRDMLAKLKKLHQSLNEMEDEFQKRENIVTKLMNQISSFVEDEEMQQKESTKIFEKAFADITTNETLSMIHKLLNENVELTNRKKDLESIQNQSS